MLVIDIDILLEKLGILEKWVMNEVRTRLTYNIPVRVYTSPLEAQQDDTIDALAKDGCLWYLAKGTQWLILLGDFTDNDDSERVAQSASGGKGAVFCDGLSCGLEH